MHNFFLLENTVNLFSPKQTTFFKYYTKICECNWKKRLDIKLGVSKWLQMFR